MANSSIKKQKIKRQKYLQKLKKSQEKKNLEAKRLEDDKTSNVSNERVKQKETSALNGNVQRSVKPRKYTKKEIWIKALMILLCIVAFVSFVGGFVMYFYRKNLVDVKLFNSGLVAVEKGDKWGYVDKYGKTKIGFDYDYAFNFSNNGLALVCTNDEYYYINSKGEVVFNYKFEKAISYDKGLAICKKNGYYGVINSNGNEIVAFRYANIQPFNGNYAIVENNDKFGIINRDGKEVISVIYDKIESVNSVYFKYEDAGRIKIATIDKESEFASKVDNYNYENYTLLENGYCIIKEDGYYGFINDKGKLISDIKYMRLDYAGDDCFTFSMNGLLFGYLNLDGKVMLEDKYKYVSAFSDGVAVVKYNISGEFIVIDKKGNENFKLEASELTKFVNGRAIFKKGALYGVVDKSGDVVCKAKYRFISNFYDDNYAVVRDTNDLYGVITSKGKEKITPEFTNFSIKELA